MFIVSAGRGCYWRKCSHLLCLSLTEIMMGPLVTFDSPGLYPVFEMQMLKCKKPMFGY